MANRDDFTPPMNALLQQATQRARSAPIDMPGRQRGQTRNAEVNELLLALQQELELSVGSPDGELDRDNNTRSIIAGLMEGLNPFRGAVSEDGVRSEELTAAIKAARSYLYPDERD